MTVSILAIGYFDGMTGYNIHTHHFFKALSQTYSVLEIDLQDTQRSIQKGVDQWISLCNKNKTLFPVVIHINQPDRIENFFQLPGCHIVFSIWESTIYPESWLKGLNKADYVFTPSEWGKGILIDNGFPNEKIAVIPEGVDTIQFNTNIPPLPALEKYNGFKFVHIGKWEDRKGSEQLIRAFEETFSDIEDAFLVLLCHNPFNKKLNVDTELNRLAPKTRSRILSINPVKDHQTIASIIRSCQCAVYPTSAEGWGLPITEAMACGLNSIVTNYSAPTDYISPATNLLLEYRLTDIKTPLFESRGLKWGQWATPDYSQLKQHMLDCFNDQTKCKSMGESAAIHVKDDWSWNNAAKKTVPFLESLY